MNTAPDIKKLHSVFWFSPLKKKLPFIIETLIPLRLYLRDVGTKACLLL